MGNAIKIRVKTLANLFVGEIRDRSKSEELISGRQ